MDAPAPAFRPGHTLHLAAGADLALRGLAHMRLRVRRGGVWLTQHRDVQDYLLVAGDEVRIASHGTVVVHALRDAEIDLVQAAPGRPGLLRRAAHALGAAWRAASAFHQASPHP